jgi:alkylation response protein AidB-like acyl-CoA dehydrogenase
MSEQFISLRWIRKNTVMKSKIKYLVPLQRRSNGAFCLSEPEAGSDATSQKTTAIDKGDHYLLNGTKIDYKWILDVHCHCANGY